MENVMCCQSQSGRMCCCSAIYCSMALKPQLLQALDLQLWQKKRECVQFGEAQQHEAGAAGEHALDGEFGPVTEGVAMFIQVLAPAVVMLE